MIKKRKTKLKKLIKTVALVALLILLGVSIIGGVLYCPAFKDIINKILGG